ncbi:MAG: zinc ribbon domain-containing protein [Oscillospiraceae bacterium]|jgi:uncharacterized membrane protein|nr:zinc ribbon domain-containing protein [Oscillospiraceae bacterium]
MAFCGYCGAVMQDELKFCTVCGKELAPPVQPPPPPVQPYVEPGYTPPFREYNDAEANKTMAVLAYILFFIPLLTGDYKKSPFVKYHTNQGTVLFIAAAVGSLVLNVASGVISSVFAAPAFEWGAWSVTWGAWAIGAVLGLVRLAYGLAVFALAVIGILNAVNGREKPLPGIGHFVVIK